MIERNGDIFDTGATYIAHGVNTQGLMGAGIAKIFRDNFFHNYAIYKRHCKDKTLVPGSFLAVAEKWIDGRDIVVVNLASQEQPGPDAQYHWLIQSLMDFARKASEPDRLMFNGGLVAIPEIGCGIGGLEWPVVEIILEAVEQAFPDIEFEVWHYVPVRNNDGL